MDALLSSINFLARCLMKEKMSGQKNGRKKYSAEFKDRALALSDKVGVSQAAEDLGIPSAMLYSWRTKRNQSGQPLEVKKLQEAEMMRLKRENTRLEEENSFLKKAAAYTAKTPK
jgi:transposase-like protein